MTNTDKTWEEKLVSLANFYWTNSTWHKAQGGVPMRIAEAFTEELKEELQKEYERGLRECNSGRVMYERGKRDGEQAGYERALEGCRAYCIGIYDEEEGVHVEGAKDGDLYIFMDDTPEALELSKRLYQSNQ